jgi:hypothetical protein
MDGGQSALRQITTIQAMKKGIKSEEQQCGWLYFAGFDERMIDQSPICRLAKQWKKF